MKKTILIFGFFILLPVAAAYSIKINIMEGKITEIGNNELLVAFGMIRGSIVFKLGEYRWPPKEIWLVPQGTLPSNFKSIGTYLEIPENVTFGSCKTSVYYNETLGYAFKVLSSQILENGTFCGLAYNGTYNILAKF
ncbi:MAG: hypothetical protein NZ942_00170 [Candidatus Aenigmarchaeota archaeon]|nr:hypothetical protein [Candidatus Aenigmarchaeota archaeon]